MTRRSLGSSFLARLRGAGRIARLGCVSAALAMLGGCSSATPASTCTSGETTSCTCANGGTGTQACGEMECVCSGGSMDSGSMANADAGADDSGSLDTPGDATHKDDHVAPSTAYSACAVQGSFGWPCSLTTSGPDPTECTDPNFPYCFSGGLAAWCTASCAQFGTCPGGDEDGGDAGCVPSACNARGYCK